MVLHPKLPSDIMYKNHSKQGKPAVTTYKVISESGNAALVEVFPKTGEHIFILFLICGSKY